MTTSNDQLNSWTEKKLQSTSQSQKKWKKSEITQSCPTLCDLTDYKPTRLRCPWNSSGKNTGVDCHSLLQGIFLTQGSNPGLLRCRQILHCLSNQGSPSVKESHNIRSSLTICTDTCQYHEVTVSHAGYIASKTWNTHTHTHTHTSYYWKYNAKAQ